jgi:hypothetical protein
VRTAQERLGRMVSGQWMESGQENCSNIMVQMQKSKYYEWSYRSCNCYSTLPTGSIHEQRSSAE